MSVFIGLNSSCKSCLLTKEGGDFLLEFLAAEVLGEDFIVLVEEGGVGDGLEGEVGGGFFPRGR